MNDQSIYPSIEQYNAMLSGLWKSWEFVNLTNTLLKEPK